MSEHFKYSRSSIFVNLEVHDFDFFFSWSPVLTQLYRLFVTGFDGSGWHLVLTSLPNPPATSKIILSSIKLNIIEFERLRISRNKTLSTLFSILCFQKKKCRCLLKIKYNAVYTVWYFIYLLLVFLKVHGTKWLFDIQNKFLYFRFRCSGLFYWSQ